MTQSSSALKNWKWHTYGKHTAHTKNSSDPKNALIKLNFILFAFLQFDNKALFSVQVYQNDTGRSQKHDLSIVKKSNMMFPQSLS